MIRDLLIMPLQKTCNERGCIYPMLKKTDSVFSEFGEIYFSTVPAGVIKGWNVHRKAVTNLVCVRGSVRIALCDMRLGSQTSRVTTALSIGDDNYVLLSVPPGIAFSFRSNHASEAMIANCSTLPYDPNETIKIPLGDPSIPYDWEERA